MINPSFEENNASLNKFEEMLKTNQVLFFDAIEFERIIHYYIDFAQFNLAKKALKMSMEQHPQNIELMLLQTEIMLLDGSYNDAQVLLEQIEKLSPENEEIFLQRANISSKQKDHSKAIKFLFKALDITDEPIEVWNLIGMEYLFLEDYIKAKDFFLRCVRENSMDYQSLYNLLYCHDQLEENIEAINTLNKILETNPYSEVAWHQLGKLYAKINKYEEALSAYEFAIISDDTFTGAYIEKGKLLEKMGRINQAIDNYEFSVKLNAPNAYVIQRIGGCHIKLGNDQLALQYFKKSIKLDPNHEKSWISLVDYFFKSGFYSKAKYYVKKSLKSNADSEELWKKSAEIHFKMNFFKEAGIASKTANELGNNDFKTWIIWMDSQMHLKDWQSALATCQLALQYFNNQSAILYRLAGCKMRLGRKNEAIDIFEKIKINFKIPEGFNQLFPELANSL
jgi:tetratricopeptide (TPR) repeat protein